MGKRADVRPEISGKLLNMVKEAQATLGKTPKHAEVSAPRPQASPARVREPCLKPQDGPVAAAPAPAAGEAPQAATPASMQGVVSGPGTPVPMSIQSTPVKSPEVKRLRSGSSASLSSEPSMSLPSLPSFSGKSDRLHGLDSQTTLDMAEYFSQLRLSGPTIAIQL